MEEGNSRAEDFTTESERTEEDALALAAAEDLSQPADDDIPAGMEAMALGSSGPSNVAGDFAVPAQPLAVPLGPFHGVAPTAQPSESSEPEGMDQDQPHLQPKPANASVDEWSIYTAARIAAADNVELLRPSQEQSVSMLTLPLSATVRPPAEIKQLAAFLQDLHPLPEVPMMEVLFLASASTYSNLSTKVMRNIRVCSEDDIRVESKIRISGPRYAEAA